MTNTINGLAPPGELPQVNGGSKVVGGRVFQKEIQITHDRLWQIKQLIKALIATIFSFGIALFWESIRTLWHQALTGKERKIVHIEKQQEKPKSTETISEVIPDKKIQIEEPIAQNGKIDLSNLKFPIEKDKLNKSLSECENLECIILACPSGIPPNLTDLPMELEDGEVGPNLTWIDALRLILNVCSDEDSKITLTVTTPDINIFSHLTPAESSNLYKFLNKQDVAMTTSILEALSQEAEGLDLKASIFRKNLASIFQDMPGADLLSHLPALKRIEGYSPHFSPIFADFSSAQIQELADIIEKKDLPILIFIIKHMQWQAKQNPEFERKAQIILTKIFALQPDDAALMLELFRCAKLSQWVVRILSLNQFDILNRKIESSEKSIGESQLLLECCVKFKPMDRLARVALVSRNRQNEILTFLESEKGKSQVRIDICLDELWRCFNGYLQEEEKLVEGTKILNKLTLADSEKFGSELASLCDSQHWHLIGMIVKAYSQVPVPQNQVLNSHFISRILKINNKNALEITFKAFWLNIARFNKAVDYLPFITTKEQFTVVLETLLQAGLSKALLDEQLETLIFGIKTQNLVGTKHIKMAAKKEEIIQVIQAQKNLQSRQQLIKRLNESGKVQLRRA